MLKVKLSPLASRKWHLFFAQKRARVGVIVFICLFFMAMFAPLFSNNKPLFLRLKTPAKNEVFFPAFFSYSPESLGIPDAFEIDYRAFLQEKKGSSFVLLPLNFWGAEEQTDAVLAAPSRVHRLGTDNLGRDVLARLIYGVRTSLLFGLLVWFFSYTVGVFIGAAQGYFLGAFDFIIERFKELAVIIPLLTFVILVTSITKQQSFFLILSMVLLFAWIDISSQIRASVLSVSQRDFCESARAMGASSFSIIVKHVLPNSLVPVITLSPFAIEAGISILAALDYLGFGLPPPTPSLGELLAQGRDNVQNAPWLLISPIVVILCLLVSISLIGQALRTAFDPRS